MKKNILFRLTVFCLASCLFSQTVQKLSWEKACVKTGEDAVLTADVSGSTDGEIVSIKIFPEGKNEKTCAPYASYKVPVENGKVKAVWKYVQADYDEAAKNNPKFIAVAEDGTSICYTKSPVEIQMNRVSVKNLKWVDENGKTIKKNVMGETAYVSAEIYGDVKTVTLRFRQLNPEYSGAINFPVIKNKILLGWNYEWDGKFHDEKPRFVFEIEAPGLAPVKSGELEVSMTYKKRICYEDGFPIDNETVTLHLMDGKTIKAKTDSDGFVEVKNLVPGEVRLDFE